MESAHTEDDRQVKVTKPRPLLRGWFHAVAAVGAVIFTIALCLLSWNDPPRMLTMLVFGLSMVELYAVSAVYHMGTWSPRVHRVLRAIDHSNIFVLIAGTYTPLCFNMLGGWLRIVSLTAIWVLALVGISLSVLSLKLPRMVGTILYIIMGWVSIGTLPALLEVMPVGAIGLLVFGGVLYTIGGLIYARKWPDPFPRVLGFHEVFHLFVVAGGVVFAVVITVWILPFPRP
jgi:hemolysin III